MKGIGKKFIAISLILLFFINGGLFYIIPVHAWSSKTEAEELINELKSELENNEYETTNVIKDREIFDWEEGDSIINRAKDIWHVDVEKKETEKYYLDSVYVSIQKLIYDTEIGYVQSDIIDEGINIFMVTTIYDIGKATISGGKDGTVIAFLIIDTNIEVTDIAVKETSIDSYHIKLEAIITPENATEQSIQWTSSNDLVATITPLSDNSKIAIMEIKNPGNVEITAETSNNIKWIKDYTIKINASRIEINKNNLELIEGAIEKLSATVFPENATDKTVTWTSNNPEVATVDVNGNVKAIKKGTATIKVISASNEKVYDECIVTVTEASDIPNKIELILDKILVENNIINIGINQIKNLIAIVLPDGANQSVEWSIEDEDVISMKENGDITGIKEGKSKITATSKVDDNISTTAQVNVSGIKSITVTPPTKTVYKEGEELELAGGELSIELKNGENYTIPLEKNEIEIIGYDENKIGEQVLTIKYFGAETNFTVKVEELEIEEISLEKDIDKKSYFIGEDIELAGGILKIKYKNGKIVYKYLTDIFNELTITGHENTKVGIQEIKVCYKGKEIKFNIEVKENEQEEKKVIGINIVQAPQKEEYKIGEILDLTGGKIRVLYEDEIDEVFDMQELYENGELGTNGFDTNTAKEQTISVTYKGFTKSFIVKVVQKEKEIKQIEIIKLPNKTTYTEDELKKTGINLDGGIILLTYIDGTTEEILMNNIGIDGIEKKDDNTYIVKINYLGETLVFDVKVKNEEPEEQDDENNEDEREDNGNENNEQKNNNKEKPDDLYDGDLAYAGSSVVKYLIPISIISIVVSFIFYKKYKII